MRRLGPLGALLGVDYVAAAGTATAGVDYTPVSGTVNFGLLQETATFTIPIVDDLLDEEDETISLSLSNVTLGGILGVNSTAELKILDSDVAPTAALNAAVNITEGNSSTTPVAIAVTLGAPIAKTVRVNYQTVNGTATAGTDYVATSGTLEFAPGETSKTISVLVNGDTAGEGNETFSLQLSTPQNVLLPGGTLQSVVTIIDDDPVALNVSVAPSTFSEAAVANLDVISGRVAAVNGVERVELSLQRISDNTFWNGRAFTSAPARFATELGNGIWKADQSTPTKTPLLAQLTSGTYLITAFAYDSTGKVTRRALAVKVVQTATPSV